MIATVPHFIINANTTSQCNVIQYNIARGHNTAEVQCGSRRGNGGRRRREVSDVFLPQVRYGTERCTCLPLLHLPGVSMLELGACVIINRRRGVNKSAWPPALVPFPLPYRRYYCPYRRYCLSFAYIPYHPNPPSPAPPFTPNSYTHKKGGKHDLGIAYPKSGG
jgi:hypothetical protein